MRRNELPDDRGRHSTRKDLVHVSKGEPNWGSKDCDWRIMPPSNIIGWPVNKYIYY